MNYSTVKITNKTANQLQVQKNVNRKRETVRDGAEFKKDITKKKNERRKEREEKNVKKFKTQKQQINQKILRERRQIAKGSNIRTLKKRGIVRKIQGEEGGIENRGR